MNEKTIPQAAVALRALRDEAAVYNISLLRLCQMAEENHTNVYRWTKGVNEPPLTAFLRTMERLEAALAAEKARLLEALTKQGRAA